MHRIAVACALLLVSGCSFDADYERGTVRCSDGACPAGLVCASGTCVTTRDDAAVADAPVADDAPGADARIAALTCVDPGPVATTGGTFMGSTAGRSSTITASCGGFVMNGPDAVYRIDTAAAAELIVAINGSYPVRAYVLAPCAAAPATPVCLTSMSASAGNPISVTTSFAGQHFVVVDGVNPAQSGDYTLTVTAN